MCDVKKLIKIKVPTKLIFSGEWAVLEHKGKAISLVVDRYIYATIQKQNKKISLNFPTLSLSNIEARFDIKTKKFTILSENDFSKLKFAQKAIELSLQYLIFKKINLKNFDLMVDSDETLISLQNGEKIKIGLGSSAAVAVAIVKSIFKCHGQNLTSTKSLMRVYKIAMLAHFFAQGKVGSGVDVAISTFGKTLFYGAPSREFLEQKLSTKSWVKIINCPWPNLLIKSLILPSDFKLAICFSGACANTGEMVEKINKFKKEKKDLYLKIVNEIKLVTTDLVFALRLNDKDLILKLINLNAKLLRKLSDESGANLETLNLKRAIESVTALWCGSKFSGAGGGDCAFAVSFDKDILLKVEEQWEKLGLYPLNIKFL